MYQKSCHMLYCSWDMVHDRCDCCFSFWAIFCPLIPPPNSLKKTANISSFHTSVPKIMITYTSIQKIMIIYYTVPKIWHVMDVIVIFHFGLSFALPVPKMIIFKKWKKWLDISSFYASVPKIMIICYTVPMIWHMTGVIVIFHFGLFFALLPS